MRRWIFSFLSGILLAQPVTANNASLPELNIILPCQKMEATLKTVRQWTSSFTHNCQLQPSTAVPNSKELCQVNASKCLPKELISFSSNQSLTFGPNCFNLALVMAGILPARRYSSPEEMAYFMNSALCQTVPASDAVKAGDIGAFRDSKSNEEVHAFIWVSPDLVYSKNGREARKPYALYSWQDINERYRFGQKVICEEEPVSCELKLTNLRCQSLQSYLEDPRNKIPKDIHQALADLAKAERQLASTGFKAVASELVSKKTIIESLQLVASVLKSAEYKKSLKELEKDHREFIHGSIQFRLNSMYQQMTYSMSRARCVHCVSAQEEIAKASRANLSK